MERRVNMEEISDGKRYTGNDLVRADCHDCEGCSACCRGMGNTIQLDPMDIYRLTKGLSMTFEQLLASAVKLQVVDGLILPNLKMTGETMACSFLNEEGRCSIHPFRPGICRLFPLGRIYENGTFQYFLQTGECRKQNRTKIKVSKWIDTPELPVYEQYISDWHYFVKNLQNRARTPGQEALMRTFSLYVLQAFYAAAYETRELFYPQFYARMEEAKRRLG